MYLVPCTLYTLLKKDVTRAYCLRRLGVPNTTAPLARALIWLVAPAPSNPVHNPNQNPDQKSRAARPGCHKLPSSSCLWPRCLSGLFLSPTTAHDRPRRCLRPDRCWPDLTLANWWSALPPHLGSLTVALGRGVCPVCSFFRKTVLYRCVL